jgi:hypothetical protein
MKHSVGDRRGNRWDRRLPCPERTELAVDDMYLYRRSILHAQHREIVKIALVRATIAKGHRSVQGS